MCSKADHATASIPVVAVTAAALPEEVRAGMEAGFHAYLTKPFNVHELMDTVRQCLG